MIKGISIYFIVSSVDNKYFDQLVIKCKIHFKQILDNIKRYVELTEEDEKEFSSILIEKTVKKKQFIVKSGDNFTPLSYVKRRSL